MPGGRPPLWTDPKALEAEGMIYVLKCIEENQPVLITGLALALNTNRETLMNYEGKDEFSDTVKRLKSYCENYAEKQAFVGKNQAGAIFALKNYGWRDEKKVDVTSGGQILQGVVVLPPLKEDLS